MHAVYRLGPVWHVLVIEAGRARFIALSADEQSAQRIAALLDRHGLVDVPLDEGMLR